MSSRPRPRRMPPTNLSLAVAGKDMYGNRALSALSEIAPQLRQVSSRAEAHDLFDILEIRALSRSPFFNVWPT